MRTATWMALALIVGAMPCAARAAGETVTIASLLEGMTDRDRIARWPDPEYTVRQASSYDRRSTAPGAEGWFANMDRSWFVRVEERDGRREHVLMDVPGPGAIVRFWATWHGPRGEPFSNGTLRFYLDGAEEPAIEGAIESILSGGALAGPPLSQFVSPTCPPGNRAHNLYLPIPYARSCRVTYETDAPMDDGAHHGEALYYQIGYRTYSPDTVVEPFSMERLEAAADVIARTSRRLVVPAGGPAGDALRVPNAASAPIIRRIDAHASVSFELGGPGAIRHIALAVRAEDEAQALRSTVLEIAFDGERTVWCPVDAFFGGGYLPRPYRSWYTQRDEDGTMHARWVMPYEAHANVTIHNLGDQPVELGGRVEAGPWAWDDRSLHFHADWRRYASIETDGPTWDGPGCRDLEFLSARGRGVLVADNLCVFNTVNAWWGEGDEKIYVDGEAFPSHFGTGTEDYYGYAWCRPEPFSSPFHAQPSGAGNFTPGFTMNLRQRLLDAIPFRASLRFDMELEHWVACTIDYTPAVFWYARPGAQSSVGPDPEQAAAAVPRHRRDISPPLIVEGAIEGEAMRVDAITAGVTEIQDVPQFRWSDDRQLWWRDGGPGDTLELRFDVEETGRYDVQAELTVANDYGIVELAVNGQPAREPFDGYNPSVEHRRFELGTFDLRAGANTLTVKITGSNEQAVARHMFGIDYLLLEASTPP